MARRLRIQFSGAIYHVINRGNLQHDVFVTDGAQKAFVHALDEACVHFGWRIHAYVVMRNHYHLALETPYPNLVDGMHWLQSTFATRLTRFHHQHGHVFQGRYQSLLIEDHSHLARVCDYIHLNPVRAGVVTANRLGDFLWSSLSRWLAGSAPDWLDVTAVLAGAGLSEKPTPWPHYVQYLGSLASGSNDDERMMRGALSRGWAIGTNGWRRALAREREHLALAPDLPRAEQQELRTARWQHALELALRTQGRSLAEAALSPKSATWKVTVARQLRATVAPPYRWLAETLCMGAPASVRAYVWSSADRSLTGFEGARPTEAAAPANSSNRDHSD